MEPITAWRSLIESDLSQDEMEFGLKRFYRFSTPDIAGMIFNGYCSHKCQHCIYHPNYSEYFCDLSTKQWEFILRKLYEDLSIRLFIDNGRSITKKNLEVIKFIKKELPQSLIGLIANGPDLSPYIDELAAMEIDWIDVSVDGMEDEHDLQRNQVGSFKKTFNTILKLYQNKISPKLSILTCMTTINKFSIVELIKFYNDKGISNFFLSPVSILKGYRPSDKLKINCEDFILIVENIKKFLDEFQNAKIEIDLFDAKYMHYISTNNISLWKKFYDDYDHMSYRTSKGDSGLKINYFPLSMSGTKEIILNCNGDTCPPLVMAKGRIPKEDLFGSPLSVNPSELIANIPYLHGFNIFINSLYYEKSLLNGEKNL